MLFFLCSQSAISRFLDASATVPIFAGPGPGPSQSFQLFPVFCVLCSTFPSAISTPFCPWHTGCGLLRCCLLLFFSLVGFFSCRRRGPASVIEWSATAIPLFSSHPLQPASDYLFFYGTKPISRRTFPEVLLTVTAFFLGSSASKSWVLGKSCPGPFPLRLTVTAACRRARLGDRGTSPRLLKKVPS